MRIVFMGTPDFAVPSLRAVAGKHEVLAVFTRPDAASGRGGKLLPSPVKAAALELGIPVETPRSLRDPQAQARLRELEPELIVVAAYGCILPPEVLETPRYGCLNVHASLLPRWRGAAPVQRAILAGDEVTGVCIMRMEQGLDTGDWCLASAVAVGDRNAQELSDVLASEGAKLLLKAIEQLQDGSISWNVQDDAFSCYAAKIEKAELLLDPAVSVQDNLRRVRASNDAAPARALVCGRPITVQEASPCGLSDKRSPLEDRSAETSCPTPAVTLEPGEVALERKRVLLGAADGAFALLQVKTDGKKAMPAAAWRAGLHDVDPTWERLV